MNTVDIIALNIIAYTSLILVFICLIWLLIMSIEGIVTSYDEAKDFLHRRKYGIHRVEEDGNINGVKKFNIIMEEERDDL